MWQSLLWSPRKRPHLPKKPGPCEVVAVLVGLAVVDQSTPSAVAVSRSVRSRASRPRVQIACSAASVTSWAVVVVADDQPGIAPAGYLLDALADMTPSLPTNTASGQARAVRVVLVSAASPGDVGLCRALWPLGSAQCGLLTRANPEAWWRVMAQSTAGQVWSSPISVIHREWLAGRESAMATVVRVSGSTPVSVGLVMAVTTSGDIWGGIGAGCTDAEIVHSAKQVLVNGDAQVLRFGFDTVDELTPMPMCGGFMEVLVERVDSQSWPWFGEVVDALVGDTRAVLVRQVDAGRTAALLVTPGVCTGQLLDPGTPAGLEESVRRAVDTGAAVEWLGRAPSMEGVVGSLFVLDHWPRPHLVVVGAVEYARALVGLANLAGFRTTVCDAREAFLRPERFPQADRLVRAQPGAWISQQRFDAATAVCVLTHDPKFDVPALRAALSSGAGFVGALGSRTTTVDRAARLAAAGVDAADIARIHAPIGLDLGGASPEETALSILAEVVAVRHGRSGRVLSELAGPIHGRHVDACAAEEVDRARAGL